MKSSFLLLASVFAMIGSQCLADTRDLAEGVQNMSQAIRLHNRDKSRDHWNGIGRLSINGTACTASLIDSRDNIARRATPAYVLTSGHCIDHSVGTIITNQPITGSIKFNYFTEPDKIRTFPLKEVKWRSMQGVDMAIVELDVSMETLISEGIRPLKVARLTPPVGSDVLIIGAPLYHSLQLSACTLQAASDIVEGPWVWRNNFMTRCKGVRGGVSGSPLLDRYTNEIVGVIGTTNDDSDLAPCAINAPCTPTESGYQAIAGNVYGNQANIIKSCFRKGVMIQTRNLCRLFPTFNIVMENEIPETRTLETNSNGTAITANWNYSFSIDTEFYRHKTVRTAKECENRSQYSEPVPATNARIDSEIGSQPGRYFLCIIGMSQGQSFRLGLLRNALSVPIVLTQE